MDDPIDAYLARLRRGLWGIFGGRREELLRDIRCQLQEELDEEGRGETGAADRILARQVPPERLARRLQLQEFQSALRRTFTAALPALAIFTWLMALNHFPAGNSRGYRWFFAVALCYATVVYLHLCLGSLWASWREPARLLLALALGFLVGAATTYLQMKKLHMPLVARAMFIGLAIERVSRRSKGWICLLDPLAWMFVAQLLADPQRYSHLDTYLHFLASPHRLMKEWVFFASGEGILWIALRLRRSFHRRWVFSFAG